MRGRPSPEVWVAHEARALADVQEAVLLPVDAAEDGAAGKHIPGTVRADAHGPAPTAVFALVLVPRSLDLRRADATLLKRGCEVVAWLPSVTVLFEDLPDSTRLHADHAVHESVLTTAGLLEFRTRLKFDALVLPLLFQTEEVAEGTLVRLEAPFLRGCHTERYAVPHREVPVPHLSSAD